MLSAADVLEVGVLFKESLLTLKHLGAQAQTAEALQVVCERLLSVAGAHPTLATAPHTWMADLLHKFNRSDAYGLVGGVCYAWRWQPVARLAALPPFLCVCRLSVAQRCGLRLCACLWRLCVCSL